MKTKIVCTQTPAGYILDVRGKFGGGHTGPAGRSAEDAAQRIAQAIARYGDDNPEGYTITAAPEVMAILKQITLTGPSESEKTPEKATRKTLHFTQATLDRLAPYVLEGEGMSQAAQWRIQRMDEIIRDAMPRFSEGEWSAILDANNGAWLMDTPAHWLTENVRDSDGLDEKWNIDTHRLVEKLQALPYAAHCAIEDVIWRFWHSPRLNDADTATLIREAGAKLDD